jgi:phage-related tail fiber protein
MPIFRGKSFVSALSDSKDSVRLASDSNVPLTNAVASIDGATLLNQDRVLLAGQANAAQNGIYVWNSGPGKLVRSFDADSIIEVTPGMRVFVEEGIANSQTYWTLTTTGKPILGTTALTFIKDYRIGDVGISTAIKSATTTINVSASEAPAAGQVLTATSPISANWQTPLVQISIIYAAVRLIQTQRILAQMVLRG